MSQEHKLYVTNIDVSIHRSPAKYPSDALCCANFIRTCFLSFASCAENEDWSHITSNMNLFGILQWILLYGISFYSCRYIRTHTHHNIRWSTFYIYAVVHKWQDIYPALVVHITMCTRSHIYRVLYQKYKHTYGTKFTYIIETTIWRFLQQILFVCSGIT